MEKPSVQYCVTGQADLTSWAVSEHNWWLVGANYVVDVFFSGHYFGGAVYIHVNSCTATIHVNEHVEEIFTWGGKICGGLSCVGKKHVRGYFMCETIHVVDKNMEGLLTCGGKFCSGYSCVGENMWKNTQGAFHVWWDEPSLLDFITHLSIHTKRRQERTRKRSKSN